MKLVNVVLVLCSVFMVVKGELQIDQPCRRNRICVSIKSCRYYMNLQGKPKFTKASRNFCGNDTIGQTYKVCCPQAKGDDLSSHRNHHLLPMNICGPVSVSVVTKITQGGNAAPREFPWMALIAYKTGTWDSPDDEDFKCGGSLINQRYILTAAHCLDDKTVLGVRLGEYDISLQRECYQSQDCEPPVQDIEIDKIIIHEDYNPSTFRNDIGLIRLSKPANMSRVNVKPICLPIGDLRPNLVGKSLTVAGWGKTETGHRSMILNKVSIPVVDLDECRRFYSKLTIITKTQICAGGYKGRDSCSGDSGGPLQYINSIGRSNKYVQYGIVSYGSKHCGVEGWPGIYTNVREYVRWILDNIDL